jgi:hypothetical protein
MKCTCGKNAALRTVTKQGANEGRRFYACAHSGCNFFQWVGDDTDATKKDDVPPPRSTPLRNIKNNDPEVIGKKCACDKDAVLRKVSKEGVNQGRYFFGCNKKDGCGFFEWCDNPEPYLNLRKKNNSKEKKSPLTVEIIAPDKISVTISKNNSEKIEKELKRMGGTRDGQSWIVPLTKYDDLAKIGGEIPDFVRTLIQSPNICQVNWTKVPKRIREALMPFQRAVSINRFLILHDELGCSICN